VDNLAAILFLTAFPGSFTPTPTEDEYPALREQIHRVALAWEILDQRETTYILAVGRRGEFANDLDLLRMRYHEYKDSPRVADAERFPCKAAACERIDFNRRYRSVLSDRRMLERDREETLSNAIAETDSLYRCWDLARNARCDSYYVVNRRKALSRLKVMLGEEDYATGSLPPNVPTWLFVDR